MLTTAQLASPGASPRLSPRLVPYVEPESDQDRCMRIADRHGVKPGNARKCFEGSEGCPTCPWKNGWSDAHRRREQARSANTPKHLRGENPA